MRQILFSSVTIPAGESVTCDYAVVLADRLNEHGMQYEITGDGTLTLVGLVSIEGQRYITNGTIASGLGKTSGPDSDGKDIIPLRLKPSDLFKLQATETGGASDAVITAWFVQK